MSTNKHYDAVILSPHFDDAVFSCGSHIARLAASHSSVLVLNLFTDYQKQTNRFLNDGRTDEENDAAKSLGFDTLSIGLVDALARYQAYQKPSNLFLPQSADDPLHVDDVVERLQTSLQSIDYAFLYVPLAVGWHVDHVLCHLAGRKLNSQARLVFYEDAPYCFIPAFTNYRLHALGMKVAPYPHTQGPLEKFQSMYAAIAQSSLSHSIPKPFRPFACAVIAFYLNRLPQRHAMGSQSLRLSEDLVAFNTGELDKKVDACNCYASQVPEFFRDAHVMRDHYLRHSRSISPASDYVERYWKIDDSSA